jgi:hypothetical protein
MQEIDVIEPGIGGGLVVSGEDLAVTPLPGVLNISRCTMVTRTYVQRRR